MPRPVPNFQFMTDLALWVQSQFRKTMPGASLLAGSPASTHALMVDSGNRDFYVLDRTAHRILHSLPLPPRARFASDYADFVFSPAGNHLCGYNHRDSSFAVWSLSEGKLLSSIDGEGALSPKAVFLDEAHVVFADSNRVHTSTVYGKEVAVTRMPEETRDMAFFPMTRGELAFITVAVIQRKNLGSHIHVFRIEKGKIMGRSEGPYRERSARPGESKSVTLHELYNIPGSTSRSLVLCEEEHVRTTPADPWGVVEDRYLARICALDPTNIEFHEGELTIEGRHCLEIRNSELHLIDEIGRRRRVHCFPLRLENADWRLEGATARGGW